jgi:hypothetical protein
MLVRLPRLFASPLVTAIAAFALGCGSSSSGAGTSSGTSGGATTAVTLVNVIYASEGLTDINNGPPVFGVTFAFAIQNDASSAILSISSFAVDVGTSHAEGPITCNASPTAWKVAAGTRVTLDGELHNVSGHGPAAFNIASSSCSSVGFTFSPAPPPATFAGSLTLTLKGTLADSTPFTATGVVKP